MFAKSILSNDRKVVCNELILKDNDFFIDFEDLEKSLSLPENKMFIFCNPHNPSGRVWSFEEVKKVTELCIKYKKILVSDEIFGEMTFKDVPFTSCSSISEEARQLVVNICPPTKAFNLSGTNASYVIIEN